jgi:hypothetical protein
VVVITNVLDIPLAGAVPALPASMLTWHFELEGAVVEVEDDEPAQAATRTASAGITNSRIRTASCRCAINLPKAARLIEAVLQFVRPKNARVVREGVKLVTEWLIREDHFVAGYRVSRRRPVRRRTPASRAACQ